MLYNATFKHLVRLNYNRKRTVQNGNKRSHVVKQRNTKQSVDVMLRNSDDRTELTHHILEDIKEENLETLKNEKGKENAKNFDTDIEESQRVRKLTGKGEEEKIRRLKQRRTNALTAVSRKRTDIRHQQVNDRPQKPRCCQS